MHALLLFRRALGRVARPPHALFAYALAPLSALWLLCQLFGRLPQTLAGFPTSSYLAFIAPALAVTGALPFSIAAGSRVLDDRDRGVLEQILAVPVAQATLLIDELLAYAMAAPLVVPVILLAERGAGVTAGPSILGALALLPIALTVNCLYAAVSMVVIAVIPRPATVPRVMGMLVWASLLLTDLFLPAALLPQWLMTLSHLNPLTYAVHGARAALWTPASWTTYARDLLALVSVTLVATALALIVHLRQPATQFAPAAG